MDELTLDQLPYLCMKRIFEYLDLSDLVRCRAVSRQFKEYAEETQVTELIVSDHLVPCSGQHSRPCSRWRLIDAPMNFGRAISWSTLFSGQPLNLNLQLKSLHVHLKDSDFDAEALNAFEHLVHLEVFGRLRDTRRGQPITLALPKLKLLHVQYDGDSGQSDRHFLNTPSLEVLKCDSSDTFQFNYPETVIQLTLYIERQLDSLPVQTLLTTLKNLKELALEMNFLYLVSYLQADAEIEDLRVQLFNYLSERDRLGREEPKIYLNNVLVESANQLDTPESMREHYTFCLKNYQRIRGSNFEVGEVNFQRLMALNIELSDEFFVKFPAIKSVHSTGPVDQDAFGCFLKNLNALRRLELDSTSLDQAFFDRLLSTISSQLTDLTIRRSNLTNFDFVLRFRQLRWFHTDQRIGSLELPAKAFRRLNDLEWFKFKAIDRYVDILRSSTIKNNYDLDFWLDSDEGEFPTSHCNLKWAELVALFDQDCPLS